MRRDYFTLDVDPGPEEGAKPVVTVDFDGPEGPFETRLTDESGETLDAARVDVAYRLQDPEMGPGATGVFSITNRITGDYVLEVNVEATTVIDLVTAARAYGKAADIDDGRYQIAISIDDEQVATYDKSTFLVYDIAGELLRQHSLIPSGVEL
ncbi:DUF5793 family protein [Halomarina ordinaria]|uniref:DUF5793 family protein n=1 Tax=Halomarina ordinaria TaxID=3033939 RepID=A0ABD5UA01_9EURY|nr:DUF5793 family protein [Halomarina sp. PSRA2]